MMTSPPLIGISACLREDGRYTWHSVAEQYVNAAARIGVPVLIPALGAETDFATLIDRLDGLVLTGSASNVEPHHYDGIASRPGTMHDRARDATTLPLIRRAIDAGLPLIALCRGHQELNVALGGTLHQHVHELPGRANHRAPADLPNAQRYAPSHPVTLTPGGMLAGLACAQRALVNSLHAQAIDRLADGLAVEAMSEDGVIEAVRVIDAPEFALGVQWHPEWSADSDSFSRAIFAAFRAALHRRAAIRSQSSPSALDTNRPEVTKV
jgi:putative glutamine amidotransferase